MKFLSLLCVAVIVTGMGLCMQAPADVTETVAEVSAIVAPPVVDLGAVQVSDQLASNDCQNGVCGLKRPAVVKDSLTTETETRGIVQAIRERKPLRSLLFRRR